MSFPDTRVSLICRIVTTGDANSWDEFVGSYWRATCRFAMRIGNLQWTDAEDVTSQVFEILYRKSLLESWLSRPDARLKTLLCTVARNAVQNMVRSRKTVSRHASEQIELMQDLDIPVSTQDLDLFYAVWAFELICTAVQLVMRDYDQEGRGDYFRVLYGRICEQLPAKDIAEQLHLKMSDVDNYFRHARQRLSERIEFLVRKDMSYSTNLSEIDAEFQHEWQRLAEILSSQGGIDEAIRKAFYTDAL